MLVFDLRSIGNKLLLIRKRMGMTQAEVAEAAGLSDRTYADIERGTVNMRAETILRICKVLHITPDQILTEEANSTASNQAPIIKFGQQKKPTSFPQNSGHKVGLIFAYVIVSFSIY